MNDFRTIVVRKALVMIVLREEAEGAEADDRQPR
jgi:hypothetical protein